MDERQALTAFAALSQETRLRIVRMLVQAGEDGIRPARSPKPLKCHLRMFHST